MSLFEIVRDSFDKVYGTLPVPVFLFDGRTQIVRANSAFLKLARVGGDRLTRFTISDFFQFLHTKRFPVPDHYLTHLQTGDGDAIPVELNHAKLNGADDASQGCIVFLSDLREFSALQERLHQLTVERDALAVQLAGDLPDRDLRERMRLEEQLKEEKAFLENFIESCGDGMFITDSRGSITRVNESFARIVGSDKQAIVGKKLYELGPLQGTFVCTTGETVTLDQSYREYTYRQMETFLHLDNGGKFDNWEFYVFNERGQIVPLDMTVTMQKNAEGVITGAVCVLRDVTQRRKAEKAIEDAYQFRSRFFANITHEFRTPLTLTVGPLEALAQHDAVRADAAMRGQLDLALRNARRLLQLINQLLDFNMLESGALTPVYEDRDVNAFVATIVESFAHIARQQKIRLAFEPCGDLGVVAIDPGKVERILFNLLGNAFKFTPEGGRVTVRTRLQPPADTDAPLLLEIAVADTGIGIPPGEIGKIFDRFYRGTPLPDRGSGGAGIGLAFAKELAEVMGGEIDVRSTLGSGSVFTLRLPANDMRRNDAAAASEPLDRDPAEERTGGPAAEAPAPVADRLTGAKRLVLVVDDNPDMLRYIVEILQHDYDVITARDGRHALERLSRHMPDIIVCDVMMPGMDGTAFLKSVKAQPALRETPFMFLTARADIEMKVQGLEEGADDYVVKPFNALELRARIKSILRIRDLLATTRTQDRKIETLTRQLQKKYHYGNIIGSTPAMRKVYQLLEAIRDSDATVLITGETGTGKELVAQTIHYTSPRRNGPFVAVNCGAIPKELMARELFGHVKGAYTGAVRSGKGYFQEADGGTLFLDEIGEMDRDMQIQLLRVLERGDVVRIGDTVPVKVNVRLIAATNKDLLDEVRRGKFRPDLYYRIHVVPVHLPPLRERRDDIPSLIEHFMKKHRPRAPRRIVQLTDRDLRLFMQYSYPGNVRELEHMIERYCLVGGSVADLFEQQPVMAGGLHADVSAEESSAGPGPLKLSSRAAKEQAERRMISDALQRSGNNITAAARDLNISRVYLHAKMKKYGIAAGKKSTKSLQYKHPETPRPKR